MSVWWHEFIPKDAVVYDVGANIGCTVRAFAPLAKRVYAFEPNPWCFAVLRSETADLANVRLLDLCLSNTIGTGQVFTYRHWLLLPCVDGDPRRLNPQYHPGQAAQLKGEFPVRATTIDRVAEVLLPPDFLKIDVDGMECAVLQGAVRTLAERQPVMYVEIGVQGIQEHGDEPREAIRLLRSAGYGFVADSYEKPLRVTGELLLKLADGYDHDINVLCVPESDPRLAQWEAPPPGFC